jgi:hypothetical protein
MTSASPEAHEWHRIIRASVRECLKTWHLQSKDGPVTVEALEAILSRSMVPILPQMEDKPPELVMALLPSVCGRCWRRSPTHRPPCSENVSAV